MNLLESFAAARSKCRAKSIAAESRINDSDGTVDASVLDRYFSTKHSSSNQRALVFRMDYVEYNFTGKRLKVLFKNRS